jgi:hypothetical protein
MDKTEIKETVHEFADKAAVEANTKAKESTGWKKCVWGIIAIIAGAIAFFTQQSCTSVTPQQVNAAHVLYHAISGEPCTLAQPDYIIVTKGK